VVSAVGVYLPEGRHPIIPSFHYSRCERSELSSLLKWQTKVKGTSFSTMAWPVADGSPVGVDNQF